MKEVFLKYLKQPSTWKGILSILVSLGVVTMSPDVMNSTVQAILLLIAAGEAIQGTINIAKDESKQKVTNVIIQTTNTIQPSTDTVNELQSGKF